VHLNQVAFQKFGNRAEIYIGPDWGRFCTTLAHNSRLISGLGLARRFRLFSATLFFCGDLLLNGRRFFRRKRIDSAFQRGDQFRGSAGFNEGFLVSFIDRVGEMSRR